jgi:dATP/dGTP diphosphohydrolase
MSEFPRIGCECVICRDVRLSAQANAAMQLPTPLLTLPKLPVPTRASTLPTDGPERKKFPVASGVLDYFPDAIVAVSAVSFAGNEQHNPGQPLHWAREKSTDQSDTMIRHYLQRGSRDVDGQRHSAKMVWRALAILQLEIEQEKK